MLRTLDPAKAYAYYAANNLGGPTVHEKVLVRVHKERVACPDLTDEERAASQAWLDDRKAQRKR
jgi:hypothetical protein